MSLTRKLLIGTLALAGAYGIYRFASKPVDAISGECLSAVLEDEVAEPKNEQYSDVSKSIDQLLRQRPEYANSLIQKCIRNMESTNTSYYPETSIRMFAVVSRKAEENPLITDFLGKNAKARIRETRAKKSEDDLKEELGEKTMKVYKDLKEKTKQIYEGIKPKQDGGI